MRRHYILGLRVTAYVQGKIIIVKINTVIVQIFMPVTKEDDDEDLNKPIDQTKNEDHLIVIKDMNATIGAGKEGTVVEQYGLGNGNDGGRRLIEF